MVLRLADAGVHRGLFQVRGFIDDDRGVAGANSVGGLARPVGSLHHRGSAGCNRQVADGHQFLCERDARSVEAQDEVLGSALFLQGGAKDPHDLERGLPAQGMGRENDGILALHRVDRHVDHGDERVGDGKQACDDPHGLRVLDDALVGQLLDDAYALGAQGVAQDPEDLPAPRRNAFGAAHPAFLDAHPRQPPECLFVGGRPGNRLAQAIDPGLVVVLHGRQGCAGAAEQLERRPFLFLGNDSGHRVQSPGAGLAKGPAGGVERAPDGAEAAVGRPLRLSLTPRRVTGSAIGDNDLALLS